MGLAGFAFGFMLSLALALGLMQAGVFVDAAGDPSVINGPGHTHRQHVHLPNQKHRHDDHLHKPGQKHEHWAERGSAGLRPRR